MVGREHMLSKSRGSYGSVLQSPAVFTKTMVQGPTCEHRRALKNGTVGSSALAEHVFSANHQVDLSKAMVIDAHNHTQTRCMLESWHIQHHQSPLNREKGTLPGLYAALLS